MRLLASVLLAVLPLAACATTGDDFSGTDELEVGSDEDGGKADANGELRLRVGETTVWVTQRLERRATENGPLFVLGGRASRNITDGLGFVIDDPYGDFATKSARTWEVTWPADYIRTLADGTNQFVRLGFVHSNGRPDSLTVRAQVRPRLLSASGSSKIYLTAELTPVVNNGETVYRLKGKVIGGGSGASARSGTRVIGAQFTSSNDFFIDLPPDQMFAKEPLVIEASLASGTNVQKAVSLGLSVKKLGLTSEDPYAKWPRATCTTERTTCLTALGGGALDTASCGEALEVLACARTVGVRVDDVAFQAANDAAHTRTGSTEMRADYAALAGADRVEQMQGGVEQSIEYALEQQVGRWYLGTRARETMLTGAVERAIVSSYAFPQNFVEPHAAGTSVAAKRQVAADALLNHLATMNFVETEFARSYEDLVTEFRTRHVASLSSFRSSSTVEPYPGSTTSDVVTGDWLGTHVEVTLDRATGEATNVLVEID